MTLQSSLSQTISPPRLPCHVNKGTNNFNNFTTIYKDYTLGAINQIAGMDVEKYIQILCKTTF